MSLEGSPEPAQAPPPRYEVAIGIPTLNGPERLDRCLRSIKAHTPLEKLRASVLVCDDGSREAALGKNRAVTAEHGVRLIENLARLGVSETWNRLVRCAVEEMGCHIVVLVNDDVEVVPDWLDALVFSVRMNAHAGMIGLNAWQNVPLGATVPVPAPVYSEAVMLHGHGMLSSCGFCFAFSADKYKAVGGFDTRYFCFYEEIGLGVEFLHHDWPSYMLSYPVVFHQVGATTCDPDNLDAAARLAESRAKFREKWTSVEHQRSLFAGRQWPRCVQWNTALKNLED